MGSIDDRVNALEKRVEELEKQAKANHKKVGGTARSFLSPQQRRMIMFLERRQSISCRKRLLRRQNTEDKG